MPPQIGDKRVVLMTWTGERWEIVRTLREIPASKIAAKIKDDLGL